jgi:hypothetical protein
MQLCCDVSIAKISSTRLELMLRKFGIYVVQVWDLCCASLGFMLCKFGIYVVQVWDFVGLFV